MVGSITMVLKTDFCNGLIRAYTSKLIPQMLLVMPLLGIIADLIAH